MRKLWFLVVLVFSCFALACSGGQFSADGGEAGDSSVSTGEHFGEQQELLCANPPVTSGSCGYQSHTRVISAIHPHPTQPYSLLFSWSYTSGVLGGTSTISFGASSGVVAKFGPDCETALGEKTPGTGDCVTFDGWTSQGPGDIITSINFPNGNAPVGSGFLTVSRWLVNGAKVLELWGTSTNSVASWHWSDTGLTKVRSDNVGDTWLYFDGYENGALVTKSLNFHCGP